MEKCFQSMKRRENIRIDECLIKGLRGHQVLGVLKPFIEMEKINPTCFTTRWVTPLNSFSINIRLSLIFSFSVF